MPRLVPLLLVLTTLTPARPAAPPTADPTPATLLARAAEVMGMRRSDGRVFHYKSTEAITQDYQSDRSYPPFFASFSQREVWLDPATGATRSRSRFTTLGYDGPAPEWLETERTTFMVRDTAVIPAPSARSATYPVRPLDPWLVVADWAADGTVRLEGHRPYRDYDRVVLTRAGVAGPERLYLDPRTGYPVALERTEAHYLWGQVAVAYLYSTWQSDGHAAYPGATFRLVDGATNITRSISEFGWMPADSAPSLAVPAASPMPLALPGFLQPTPPDTVRIGASAFLLVNRGYTEAVVLARDTVWMLDATQGDERARQDSVWIGRLFPGRHPIALVVTDLAWPHIAGVRWWVANGATVVSHAISRPFLEQVVARRWTLSPDRLERARPRPALHFRPVRDSLVLAAGALRLYPIDGIASEGALMAYVAPEQFLWASDYVQTLTGPSQYALEVAAAARRAGIAPARLAAQHLRLTDWAVLARVTAGVDSGGS